MSSPYQYAVAFGCLAASLTLTSPSAAQEAVTSNPRDAATAAVVSHLRDRDPQAALVQLGEIVSDEMPIQALIKTPLPSAAGGVFRSLSHESVDDQFEWLSAWTMPNESRQYVRLLATPVPVEAPPKAFARELGERPRDNSFNVASVGPIEGFFSTGWMFVQAADEIGRLTRLRADLAKLADDDVPAARDLHMLSQIAGSRGDLEMVQAYLVQQAERAPDQPIDHRDLIVASIACAALNEPSLQSAAVRVLQTLVDEANTGDPILLRPFFRIAHTTAIQLHYGTSDPMRVFQNRFRYWVPVSLQTTWTINRGRPDGHWLVHEDHILHLAGGQPDLLICSIPLTGDFDFVCETQEGGDIGTDGGIAYGGLQFQAIGRTETLTIANADNRRVVQRHSPFARFDSRPIFNRVSIRSRDGIPSFESNFHPVWTGSPHADQSPWIALRSDGTKRPMFRSMKLSGAPTIPNEVRLSDGDHLRGWQTGFFNQVQPAFDETTPAAEPLDWHLKSGILTSTETSEPIKQRSLIQYQRPLLDEESITYEFHHDGADSVLHPTLGRLAFLLEPNGIRIRWITTGDRDWTALPADNALLEPLSRRGSRELPLKENDWNQVTVRQSARDISIELNGEQIYLRRREDSSAQQFALYRATRNSPAQARNIVLTGDWPKTVPADLFRINE